MARKKKTEEDAQDNKMFKEAEKADPTSDASEGKAPETEVIGKQAELYPGSSGVIDEDTVHKALEVFQRYKEGKSATENRAKENQEWFKTRYASFADPNQGAKTPDSNSAWLFNSIINKHADAMDNYPEPNILAREESDKETAERLSKIVPLILEKIDFEQSYSDFWWDKLIGGGGIYKIFWNNSLENGLGDVDVKVIDVLNLFWEEGIENIQDSANVFHVGYEKRDDIVEEYPFMRDKIYGSGEEAGLTEYSHENNQKGHEDESLIYDWYYKKRIGTRTVVHLCRFCCGQVLWASENTEEYAETGYYDHGRYPFVLDTMFPLKGTPYGFSYVDIMKNPQWYIDKLDTAILKNATMSSKKRFFKNKNIGVNMEQFADWDQDFVDCDGSQLDDERLREIQVSPMPNFVINHWQNKIDELKETSGNRDFSQGTTTSGVTSGTAIAALQEAGSKTSRDMIKSSYRAYQSLVEMVVELVRQFYTEERYFRIEEPNGDTSYIGFDNRMIQEAEMMDVLTGEIKVRRPVFDFKISAQKQSPFQRVAQNELAKELYGMGVFNPQMADQVLPMLNMMMFEGIDQVRKTVSENGMMYKQLEAMTALAMQFAQQIDELTGGMAGAMMQVQQVAGAADPTMAGKMDIPESKPTGADGMPATDNTQATKARVAAASRTAVR